MSSYYTETDYQAALDLASEISFGDAIKFLRIERNVGIVGAKLDVDRAVSKHPDSRLAQQMRRINGEPPLGVASGMDVRQDQDPTGA